ncbi:type II secretion system inner membrane protein GspF [Candidatus Symbiobacter mobilis]|uniref:General secretion pathway protein F n=1 Tax=Candidatus Symbiobacter mobilis CR TaxID=946483 RepID=U5NCB5_9BURK|nr:type II secretion system inner membrane protein GspF [Candidatus Symbiobacter mobilis]AGX87848.1 general secretion pathway protein F [Candidatus Symbiobacter mobilis CR]
MPAYSYEALDAQGKPRKGVLHADSLKTARSTLRMQAMVPLTVSALGAQSTPTGGTPRSRKVFSAAGLALWTRQIAGLVSCGLPLERALSSLADEAERASEHELLATLCAEVGAGATFAKALAQFPGEFPEVYVAVVRAGEHSGDLGLVLERMADELEAQQALRSKLFGAALYPAIVTVLAIAIVAFLVTYVVPQVANVFAGSKRALPLLTTILLAISAFLRSHGWWIVLTAVAAAIAAKFALRDERVQERVDAAWLTLPLLGKLSRSYHAARFASTLALLAAAGVPILKALQAAAETLGNRALRSDALHALQLVREGAPLASALAQHKRFPAILSMFSRLGEQTGQLPLMLHRAASQLSGEVQRRAMQLATVLEPLLIVAMGAVVMLIVLAVLLPIIQLNQLVR